MAPQAGCTVLQCQGLHGRPRTLHALPAHLEGAVLLEVSEVGEERLVGASLQVGALELADDLWGDKEESSSVPSVWIIGALAGRSGKPCTAGVRMRQGCGWLAA